MRYASITGLGNRSNGSRFDCLSEVKILLIFIRRKDDSLRSEVWMSAMGWSSKSKSQEEVDKRIEPYEQCVEDDHVIGNIDLECDPLGCSMYNEDVVLYLGCHHDRLGNYLNAEIEKSS